MIEWFLGLFPQYDALRRKLGSETSRALELQRRVCELDNQLERAAERLDAAHADRDQLWALVSESMKAERYTLQSTVNMWAQRSGAGAIFPDAHRIPDSSVPKVQPGGPIGPKVRQTQTEAAAAAAQKAIKDYIASMAAVS